MNLLVGLVDKQTYKFQVINLLRGGIFLWWEQEGRIGYFKSIPPALGHNQIISKSFLHFILDIEIILLDLYFCSFASLWVWLITYLQSTLPQLLVG